MRRVSLCLRRYQFLAALFAICGAISRALVFRAAGGENPSAHRRMGESPEESLAGRLAGASVGRGHAAGDGARAFALLREHALRVAALMLGDERERRRCVSAAQALAHATEERDLVRVTAGLRA